MSKLTSKNHWKNRFEKESIRLSRFFYKKPSFIDLHHLFKRNLPINPEFRFLEIGCYPGKFMRYFHEQFKYEISGLEYIDFCCERMRKIFANHNIPCEIINEDFFQYDPNKDRKNLWDVVFSAGFVEHFRDDNLKIAVKKHFDLLKTGGYLVLIIPNHAGFNGKVMKMIDYSCYKAHNLMTYDFLLSVIYDTCKNVDILEGGYYSHFGLFNTGLYGKVGRINNYLQYALLILSFIVELPARLLPNSPYYSPHIAVVCRKLINVD